MTEEWVDSDKVCVGDVVIEYEFSKSIYKKSIYKPVRGPFVVKAIGPDYGGSACIDGAKGIVYNKGNRLRCLVQRAAEQSAGTVEMWVKATEVQVGDVPLDWRMPSRPEQVNMIVPSKRIPVKVIRSSRGNYWDGRDGTFAIGTDGNLEWFVRRSAGAPVVAKPSDWNDKCIRCGANVYNGLFKVDHDGPCK